MEIITTHTNTDMDALASMVAARKLYPGAKLVLPGVMSRNVEEFMSLHKDAINIRTVKQIDLNQVQRVVVVDTKSPRRLGKIAGIIGKAGVDVHIYDHHPWAPGDIHGAVEVVDVNVGAAVTLLVERIRQSELPINTLEATIFCLGVYYDTGSLVFTNTTYRDLDAVSYLLQKGANLAVVADFLSRPMTGEQKELLRDLLVSAQRYQINGVKVLITKATASEYVVGLAIIAHSISEIEQLDAVFIVAEMDDRVHLVGRSSILEADVAEILKCFGGGGHPKAASAVVKNSTLDDVCSELLEVVRQQIKPALCAADIMSSPVKTVSPDIPIEEAGQVMLRYGHTGFPVVREEKLVGVISRRDVEKAIRHGLGHAPVKGFMTINVVSIPSDMPVSQLEELVIDHDIGRVPVVENEKIIGIVSRTDILRTLHGEIQARHRIVYNKLSRDLTDLDISWAMKRNLPDHVHDILCQAGQIGDEQGYKVYVAGGIVRDILLGVSSLDVDLVVEGDGIALAEAMAQKYQVRIRKHQQFGTAEVLFSDDFTIDVATARVEFYAYPAALPQVESSTLHQDLYRRDFTINAMAVSLNKENFGILADFFNGQEDLQTGTIRVLYNLSFIEDPTRILRAVRFEQRYDFKIEPQTLNFLQETLHRDVMAKVSNERIGEELKHMLLEPKAADILERLAELNIWPYVFPEVCYDDVADVLKKMPDAIRRVNELNYAPQDSHWLNYLIAILHMSDTKTSQAICNKYSVGKKTSYKVLSSATSWQNAVDLIGLDLKRIKISDQALELLEMPKESAPLLLARLADEKLRKRFLDLLNIINNSRPVTGGQYIKQLGYRPGPLYRETLDALWREKLDGNLCTEEAEQTFIRDFLAEATKRSQ